MHSTKNDLHSYTGHALLILPAVLLGVLTMASGGVSPVLWGQQLAAWLVFALLAYVLQRAAGRISDEAWSVLLLLPLVSALTGDGLDGVKRWLDLGIFQINAGLLVLPALLLVLHRLSAPFPMLLAAAAILSFQPDLSQLTAFIAAVLPILWRHRGKRFWVLGSILVLFALEIRCLCSPVMLEPAAYCEGILTMLRGISPLLPIAGFVSLAAIPSFFAFGFLKNRRPYLLSLSVYYAVSLLFTLSGNDPVLFMGFGLSPIAGYFLVLLLKE